MFTLHLALNLCAMKAGLFRETRCVPRSAKLHSTSREVRMQRPPSRVRESRAAFVDSHSDPSLMCAEIGYLLCM